MNDEAFLRAIEASPTEAAPRLIYADWLEEHGDVRAEFLRLACAAPGAASTAANQRLEELTAAVDARWVARVLAGWLCYHRLTFALLGETPKLSKSNLKRIERWERRHGMTLPASLREWYALDGAEQRLGFDDKPPFAPHPLQRSLTLADPRRRRQLPGAPTYFSLGLWENTEWGASAVLDGRPNPLVALGGDIDFGMDFTRHFAAFAFLCGWYRLARQRMCFEDAYLYGWGFPRDDVDPDFALLRADVVAFGARDGSYLAARFTEGLHHLAKGRWLDSRHPQTGDHLRLFRPASVLRFFSPGVRVNVVCLGNPSRRAKPSYWEISADSEEQLFDAVALHLWGHRTLAQTLTSPTRAGKAVLAKLRRQAAKKG
jgi:uncharacterized protein (TIGR02996 family)